MTTAGPSRPIGAWIAIGVVTAAAVVSIGVLDWDFASLFDARERAAALGRMGDFLRSFGVPDLSSAFLAEATAIAIDTLAIALLAMALGIVLGYGLALGAARCVAAGSEPPPGARGAWRLRRAFTEACRVVLDVLRGVPDFAWAIVVLTIPGPGPVAGILAIGLNAAGILGKMYSEIWDSIPERRYEAVRTTTDSRLATLFYGIQPLAARSMLSFTLMRTECAIRNASVIGIICQGGLGARMFDELGDGNYSRVVTLLLFTLILTAGTDILSNFLRSQLRSDPNHPRAARGITFRSGMTRRAIALGAIVIALLGSFVVLREDFNRALGELGRIEWTWIRDEFGMLLQPDLAPATLLEAARECVFPLAVGLLATLGGVVIAALLSYPASVAFQIESHRFTGERTASWVRAVRFGFVIAARGLALVFRAVPEVAWILVLAILFDLGVLAGVVGVALHSGGVLARVYTEAVDNLPYREFERAWFGSRLRTFLYAALPGARADLSMFSIFQFESNVRSGIVLGVIGIGGIGDAFDSSFKFWSLHRASTFLIAMILLTVLIDRFSRSRYRALDSTDS